MPGSGPAPSQKLAESGDIEPWLLRSLASRRRLPLEFLRVTGGCESHRSARRPSASEARPGPSVAALAAPATGSWGRPLAPRIWACDDPSGLEPGGRSMITRCLRTAPPTVESRGGEAGDGGRAAVFGGPAGLCGGEGGRKWSAATAKPGGGVEPLLLPPSPPVADLEQCRSGQLGDAGARGGVAGGDSGATANTTGPGSSALSTSGLTSGCLQSSGRHLSPVISPTTDSSGGGGASRPPRPPLIPASCSLVPLSSRSMAPSASHKLRTWWFGRFCDATESAPGGKDGGRSHHDQPKKERGVCM